MKSIYPIAFILSRNKKKHQIEKSKKKITTNNWKNERDREKDKKKKESKDKLTCVHKIDFNRFVSFIYKRNPQ